MCCLILAGFLTFHNQLMCHVIVHKMLSIPFARTSCRYFVGLYVLSGIFYERAVDVSSGSFLLNPAVPAQK